MSDDLSSSVIRMIRASAVACAIACASVVYFSNEPKVSALSTRLDETSTVLRSDDIILSTVGRLRAQRDFLRRRYARMLRRDVEGTFLQDLDANVRRHKTDVISTTAQRDMAEGPAGNTDTGLRKIDLTLELRGRYRNLLSTIADLSAGNQIVDVRAVSLRRTDSRLIARVPISLFEEEPTR
jgi:Tfp pilus assembly protein PilO